MCIVGVATVYPRTRSFALRCAGAPSPRTSLRVQAFTIRLCRTRPSLRRRPGGRACVFVIDGRRRSAGRPNARRISADLRLSTDRIDEAVYAVLMRLAASTASATFSYSCRDTREFRETYASWLMLQAFRLQRGDATLSYHQMKAELGEPKSAVPEDRQAALSSGGWWLRSVVGTGDEGIKVLKLSIHRRCARVGPPRAAESLPSSLSSMDTCPTRDPCSILVRPKPPSQ